MIHQKFHSQLDELKQMPARIEKCRPHDLKQNGKLMSELAPNFRKHIHDFSRPSHEKFTVNERHSDYIHCFPSSNAHAFRGATNQKEKKKKCRYITRKFSSREERAQAQWARIRNPRPGR